MTEDLAEQLASVQRAMAAPLPSPEELAASKEDDRAMAERIHKARPGVPLHHAYAVLETLRTLQRVETAKAEPQAVSDLYFCPTAREVESATGGGFDTCCAHPELHVPMLDDEATAAVLQALSDAAKREFALQQQVARIRAFLEDMAGWCSPHGVAADYSRRALDALDGVDPLEAISAKPQEQP